MCEFSGVQRCGTSTTCVALSRDDSCSSPDLKSRVYRFPFDKTSMLRFSDPVKFLPQSLHDDSPTGVVLLTPAFVTLAHSQGHWKVRRLTRKLCSLFVCQFWNLSRPSNSLTFSQFSVSVFLEVVLLSFAG